MRDLTHTLAHTAFIKYKKLHKNNDLYELYKDLKSAGRKALPVQFRPSAPLWQLENLKFFPGLD